MKAVLELFATSFAGHLCSEGLDVRVLSVSQGDQVALGPPIIEGDPDEMTLLQISKVINPILATQAGQELEVGWLWPNRTHGGELHVNIDSFIALHPDQSAPIFDFLRLAAPEPKRCQCKVERWDQYAVCESTWPLVDKSLSLGVDGYDPYGFHVKNQHDHPTSGYDCFNLVPPKDFEMDFHAECIGGQEEVIDGRPYTTLASVLADSAERSVIVKMDIEESEWEALGTLSDEDFSKISSLHVEYHFNHRCPDEEYLEKARVVMERVREHLAVIDGIASIYGDLCKVGGIDFPRFFAVSYAAEAMCSAKTPGAVTMQGE